MSSLMSRVRASGVSCKPLSERENASLVERLRSGELSARDHLIHGNMALVTFRVERYIAQRPRIKNDRDDLLSEGTFALIQAVDLLQSKAKVDLTNLTGFLSTAIQRHLGHVIDKDSTIAVPDRTVRHHRQKHRESGAAETDDEAVSLKPQFSRDADITREPAISDPIVMLELWEEIEASCETEIDLQIVRRAAMGDTEKDIGEAVGLPRLTIHRRKNAIYDRFLERTGMKRK